MPLYVAVGVGLLLIALVAAEAFASVGRVHPGVSVAGIEIGGMIPEKAELELRRGLARKTADPVVVVYGDDSWSISAADVGLVFDYSRLVDESMAVGREGGPFGAPAARLRAWVRGVSLAPQPVVDQAKMAAALSAIADGTNVAPTDAAVRIDGVEATVVPGEDGLALDKAAAQRAVLAAMLATNREVDAPIVVDPVKVTDAEAQRAAAVAQQMMSGPVEITFKSKSWTFEPEDVAEWIDFRRSDQTRTVSGEQSVAATETSASETITLITLISPRKAGKTVRPAVGAKIGKPARDARFKTRDGSVTIIPSKNGIGPDIETLAAQLTDRLADRGGERAVELRTTIAKPKLTTQMARDMGIKERISRFTTTYSAGNRPRVNNIHLLGDALDGTLVAPGKSFSFNGAVGQRTAAKGYQEANAIVNGKLVPQLGGGICQVGTTIFNAVYESGLPVMERRNHSFYISHYPKGRDATVSWGGPDIKFKNTTKDWVLVSVSYTDSSITIALYGNDPGYDVESEVGKWRNMRSAPVEEIKDPKMTVGSRVVEDPGVDGRTITVKRIVSKDGKVVRTDTFLSVYKPKVEVVRVGTKPKKPPADPTQGDPTP